MMIREMIFFLLVIVIIDYFNNEINDFCYRNYFIRLVDSTHHLNLIILFILFTRFSFVFLLIFLLEFILKFNLCYLISK
jgi:hypothetical protein